MRYTLYNNDLRQLGQAETLQHICDISMHGTISVDNHPLTKYRHTVYTREGNGMRGDPYETIEGAIRSCPDPEYRVPEGFALVRHKQFWDYIYSLHCCVSNVNQDIFYYVGMKELGRIYGKSTRWPVYMLLKEIADVLV